MAKTKTEVVQEAIVPEAKPQITENPVEDILEEKASEVEKSVLETDKIETENKESVLKTLLSDSQPEENDPNHLTHDQAREEITEFNQLMRDGKIPQDSKDSIDVALEKAKSVDTELYAPEYDDDEFDLDPDHEDTALEMMEKNDLKEIWRCPETGYWFSKAQYAEENAQKQGVKPEHYTRIIKK
ncbi:hypothetical protein [Dysgonomonas sp. 520]|uniref:hypothetical protein n=1 Tax=Dysgonomonas sp. 520 TaxID=2302931 RepID=UPI0013D3514B|nr:hypothetical protein [Dysgonomonas sp. 520]NDW10453.1 hypothetical protein [Dysgonomonas sp. 520]